MNRLNDIRNAINETGLGAILLLDEYNRRFASGFPSSDGAIIISKDRAYFITDSRYIEAAKKSVTDAEVLEITGKYPEMINKLLSDCGVKAVGFEEESISYKTYQAYSDSLEAELVPAQTTMRRLRSVKTGEEIGFLQRAQDVADKAFSDILKIINTNMTERDLAAELIYRMMRYGADKTSFDPIVVSGPNSSRPHGVPGDRRLDGFVTMDFGCVLGGYCSDMTRTVCLGAATEEMKAVYNTVLKAQLAGIAEAKAGVYAKNIDGAAREVIKSGGYGDYFGHGFGHSVGLEVHDGAGVSPASNERLPAGFVTSAEPGIYIPGKFGVRIEDVIVITEKGSTNLTKSPKNLIEL